jgi:RNA recognition motif-containing protein
MQRTLDLEGPIGEPRPETLGAERRWATRPHPDASPPQSNQDDRHESVYVSNLPWAVTPEEIGSMFGRFGAVHQITIVTDRKGRSRGFGFVDMYGPAADEAVTALNGSLLGGRALTVRMARPTNRHR